MQEVVEFLCHEAGGVGRQNTFFSRISTTVTIWTMVMGVSVPGFLGVKLTFILKAKPFQ